MERFFYALKFQTEIVWHNNCLKGGRVSTTSNIENGYVESNPETLWWVCSKNLV